MRDWRINAGRARVRPQAPAPVAIDVTTTPLVRYYVEWIAFTVLMPRIMWTEGKTEGGITREVPHNLGSSPIFMRTI